MISETPLLDVSNLNHSFETGRTGLFGGATVQVLRDVDLSIGFREIVGLVGESGSGKSTIGKAILRLIEPSEGKITFDGQDMAMLSAKEMQKLRQEMQIIFQDPYSSLDPRKTVRSILSEALDTFGLSKGIEREQKLQELLDLVGLHPALLDRFPHEFSGGQRQRIGIARAMSVGPRFIVADEAVSALDVSIQAQVINLIAELRARKGVSILFISHDLSVVRFISDRIVVLYLGSVMETGPAEEVYRDPLHPYSKILVAAEPRFQRSAPHLPLNGAIPSALSPPSGCVFRTRCPIAQAACAKEVPYLRETSPGRFSACIFDQG